MARAFLSIQFKSAKKEEICGSGWIETILDETIPELHRAISFYMMCTAFHLAFPIKHSSSFKFLVPEKLFRDVVVAMLCKVLEVEMPANRPIAVNNPDVSIALQHFLTVGGFKALRRARSSKTLQVKLDMVCKEMLEVGKLISVPLRESDPRKRKSPSAALDLCDDLSARKMLDLGLPRTDMGATYRRISSVLPFAHLVYVTSKSEKSLGRLPRLTQSSRAFVRELRARVRDKDACLRFLAGYNETCRQLHEAKYDCCSPLAIPDGVVLPFVRVLHEPLPKDFIT